MPPGTEASKTDSHCSHVHLYGRRSRHFCSNWYLKLNLRSFAVYGFMSHKASTQGKVPFQPTLMFGTISLKGIVQRKGPVALPSSGRKRTIWSSRVYASPEPSITAGKFGVVVKVLDLQSTGGFDRGSSPVGPKVFFLGKKGKKKAASLLCLSFSPQRVVRLSPVCHQPHI